MTAQNQVINGKAGSARAPAHRGQLVLMGATLVAACACVLAVGWHGKPRGLRGRQRHGVGLVSGHPVLRADDRLQPPRVAVWIAVHSRPVGFIRVRACGLSCGANARELLPLKLLIRGFRCRAPGERLGPRDYTLCIWPDNQHVGAPSAGPSPPH